MCSRFQSVRLDSDLRAFFQAQWREPPADELKQDVFPGYAAPFIRRPPELSSGDQAVPAREAILGSFGLLPHWAKDEKLAKKTYNARSETVSTKPAFRDAWRHQCRQPPGDVPLPPPRRREADDRVAARGQL